MAERTAASAPAKLILFGEHSVVYGRHALACAIDLRTVVTRTTTTTERAPFVFAQLCTPIVAKSWASAEAAAADRARMAAAHAAGTLPEADRPLLAFLAVLLSLPPPLRSECCREVDVSSSVPIGAGLGSSAAFSVALAGALLGSSSSRDAAAALALEAERVFHAQPSGVDSAVSACGGALLFSRQKKEHTQFRMPPLRVVVVDTGVQRSTRDAVLAAKARLDALPSEADRAAVLDRMDGIALRAANILQNHDLTANDGCGFEELGSLIDENHAILRDVLHVSHPALERAVAIARAHGLHAKLTGAGCGGCAFAIVPPAADVDAALSDFCAAGFRAFPATLGAPGLSFLQE